MQWPNHRSQFNTLHTRRREKIDKEIKLGLYLNRIGNVSFARCSFECLNAIVSGVLDP